MKLAFCVSAFDAPTVAAAESAMVAHRETPKTGGNKFPFTRMRRIERFCQTRPYPDLRSSIACRVRVQIGASRVY